MNDCRYELEKIAGVLCRIADSLDIIVQAIINEEDEG